MLSDRLDTTRVESLQASLDGASTAARAHGESLVTLHQDTSAGINDLGARIDSLSMSQEALLGRQHSTVLAQFEATHKNLQQASTQVEMLYDSVDSQVQQLTMLDRNLRNSHGVITARVQENGQHTQEGLDVLSTKSDQILHAISEARMDQQSRKQLIQLNGQDEVLLLLFQL